MKILSVENKDYKIPSSWNELSKKDLLEICNILLLPVDNNYKRCLILSYFTDISYNAMLKWDENSFPEVFKIFDYLFKDSRLTINYFNNIGKMKGPEPGLSNFTFEQYFAESEAYYYLIKKNGSDNDLDSLINCMYNYNGTDENKRLLKNLKESEKLAIFFFYEGSSAFIKLKFKEIFSTSKTQNKTDGLDFIRLVNSINKGDLSKNILIKNSNLYEALTYLQNLINDGSK